MDNKGNKVVGDPTLDDLGLGEEVTVLPAGQRPPQIENGTSPSQETNQPTSPQNPNSQVFNPPAEPAAKPVEGTETAPPSTPPPVQTNEPPVNPPSEPAVTQTPNVAAPVDPNAQAPPVPGTTPPVVANPWDTVFKTVKEKTGIQFDSQEQMLTELTAYNKHKLDPNAHLRPEIKAHADFLDAKGDTNEFYRLKSLDFKNMSDKEVLYQSYLRDNPDHAKDQDFARMYFDKQFGGNYQLLSDPKKTQADFENDDAEPDAMAYQNYLQNYTFAEKSLTFESNTAREKLVSWQDKATTPPTHPSTGMTEKEAIDFNTQYMTGVDQVKLAYKGEVIPISDNVEENLKLGLNDSIKPQWEQDLVNPMGIFKEMGLHEDGKLDLEKLAKASFVWRIWPKIGPIVSKLILESENRQTLTGQQVNATATTPSATAEPGLALGDDEEAEAAGLFAEKIQRGG